MSKKNKITSYHLLSSQKTTFFLVIFFFLYNIFNIFKGGTTYDTMDLRFGSHRLLDKLILMTELNFSNQIFDQFTSTEYFGLILIFPIYILSHIFNLISYDFFSSLFISNDSYIYFLIHFFLLAYVSFSLFFISRLLEKKYSRIKINLFLISLFLVPSFTGHALFNLKDIPYLLQLLMFNIFFLNTYSENNYFNFSKKRIFLIATFMALSTSIRINAYLFIFFTIFFVFIKLLLIKKLNKIFILENVAAVFSSFIFLFILSPQGWLSPVLFLKKSISHQFNHGWPGSTLTNGEYVIAQDVTRDYLFQWFFSRMPLFIFLGILLFAWYLFNRSISLNAYSEYSIVIIFFVFASFPLLRPTAYDGLRHFLFIIPYLVIIFIEVIDLILKKPSKSAKLFILFIFIYSVFTQIGLGPYKYSYFNETVSIEETAYFCEESIDGCGNWPTDYWGYKGKEIAQHLNTNYSNIISGNNLLICKPKHTVVPYLIDEIKHTTIDNLKSGDTVYVVTYHRPRYMEDSCYFSESPLRRECVIENIFKQRIRFSKITLGYLTKCQLS